MGVVYKVFFTAMKDYTRDSRGDIGALVREAGMKGIEKVSVRIVDSERTALLTLDQ